MKDLSTYPENVAKKLTWLWILLLILPFVITALIQFSCFPMITSGKLRRVCYAKPDITEVLNNRHTHGNTLYDIATDAVLNKDQDLLNDLDINLERLRVDYNSQTLEDIISGIDHPIVSCANPPCEDGTDPPCNVKPPLCESKLVRNLGIGIMTGLTIGGLVLTVGSGGLLAPIAAGAALAGGTATTWLVEQLSKCP